MNIDQRYQKLYEPKPKTKNSKKASHKNQSAREAKLYYRKTLKSLENDQKILLSGISKKYPSIKNRMILNYCEKHDWQEKYIKIDLKHLWNIKKDIIGNKTISHSSDESEVEEEENLKKSPHWKKNAGSRQQIDHSKRKKNHYIKGKNWKNSKRYYDYQDDHKRKDSYRTSRYYERGWKDKTQYKNNNGYFKNKKSKRENQKRNRQDNKQSKDYSGRKKEEKGKVSEEKKRDKETKKSNSKNEENEEPLDFSNEFMKKENMESPKSLQIIETFKEKETKNVESQFAKETEEREETEEQEVESPKSENKKEKALMDEMNDSFKLIISEKNQLGTGFDHSSMSNQIGGAKNTESSQQKKQMDLDNQYKIRDLFKKTLEKYGTVKRVAMDQLREFIKLAREMQIEYMKQMGFGHLNNKNPNFGGPKSNNQNGVNPQVFDDLFNDSVPSNINQQTLYARGVKNVTSNFTINTGIMPTSRRKVDKMEPMDAKVIGSSPEIFKDQQKFLLMQGRLKAQKISERMLKKPQPESFQNKQKMNSLSLNMENQQTSFKGRPNQRPVIIKSC